MQQGLEIIDTHCHLDFPEFDPDRDAILQRCAQFGIGRIVVPGVTLADIPRLLRLTRSRSDIYPALGLHPCFMNNHQANDVDKLAQWVEQEQPIAIGEIGLDFFIADADQDAQLVLFKAQLKLARRYGLPVLLHVRKAHDQVLKCVRETQFSEGGIVHAYSGSKSQAERYLAMGFRLGIGGAATYDRAHRLHRLLKELPLESFVLETDAPDIPPCFAQGERNSPDFLLRIAQRIAELTGIDVVDLIEATTRSAMQVLRLPTSIPVEHVKP